MKQSDWPALQAWFLREGVDYPWGEHPDAYGVWISEIMLQQTQVRAVIPYFIHWMETYPDLQALASASEEQVMRSWEGLGYYSRARNIHRCAKELIKAGKFQLPEHYEALVSLPGIGPYTAAAVASIAHGQPVPVLDANVKRLCQRWGCHEEWNRDIESLWMNRLTAIIAECGDPGQFNCALMQLGQLLCRKSSPRCDVCPLSLHCCACKEGRQAEIPAVKSKKILSWSSKALIFYHDEAVFLEYRDKGIGKGLWSLPRIPMEEENPEGWMLKVRLKKRNHHFTTNREELVPLVLIPSDERVERNTTASFSRTCWQPVEALSDLAMPAVYRRILEDLRLFLKKR